MKRFLTFVLFIGLIGGLAACSGDSPSAKPVPTVVPDTWAVTLQAVPSSQYVGNVVTLQATVTQNGSPAPDGTTVIFLVGGSELSRVASSGGAAITGFTSSEAGAYAATARAHGTTSPAVTVTFMDRDPSEGLEIFSLAPNEGAYDGGEQVTIYGKGILQPVEVSFTTDGGEFEAEVVSVQESVPLESQGSIVIRTPQFGGLDRTVGQSVDVNVTRNVVEGGGAAEDSYTLPGGFTLLAEAELQIVQPIVPNSASFGGGETVRLNGRGIRAPARVIFIVEGTEYPGDVQNVVESVPLSAMGYIDVNTPYLALDLDTTQNYFADVRVEVAVDQPGTGEESLTETLTSAFVFRPVGVVVGNWTLLEPSLYLVVEDHGASAGGETVTLVGRNFRAFKYDNTGQVADTAPAIESVTFGNIEGQVISVSTDGTQAQVMTPRYSVTPLQNDDPVDVTVTTQYPISDTPDIGPFTATKQNGYVFLADEPTPELTAISPIAGPLDGGTIVTIFGHGFQFPVQVTFGVLECENVNLNDDQSLADMDTITCEAPDYSQQNQVPPVEVDVVVRNVNTGKTSNSLTYTYGDNLYITGNTPSEGRRGDAVIIYGSGFEDPLQVSFSNYTLEVLSVSGTELLVKFPETLPAECTDQTGPFTVTLLERNTDNELGTASGGSFTYLGNSPTISNVQPIFVSGGEDISIFGDSFAEDLQVTINTVFMDQNSIDVVDDTLIEVEDIPDAETLAIDFDEQACLDSASGRIGVRDAPTAVPLSVINFPGACSDTLPGALVFQPPPGSDICRFPRAVLAPNVIGIPYSLVATVPPAAGVVNLANNSDPVTGADLTWTADLVEDIPGAGGTWTLDPTSGVLAPGDNVNLTVTYTDVDAVQAVYTAQIVLTHNDNEPGFPNPVGPVVVTVTVGP